jgi:hypothetical protein
MQTSIITTSGNWWADIALHQAASCHRGAANIRTSSANQRTHKHSQEERCV